MTGFQKYHIKNHSELVSLVKNTLKTGNKLKFLQTSLTGALDNYKFNTHVSMKCSLRNFRTVFDSKREIIINNNSTMYETKPYKNKETCILHRSLLNNFKTAVYNRYMDNKIVPTSNNIVQESIKYLIRSFVNYYNNSTCLDQKISLISILKGYNLKGWIKKDLNLFKIIADSEINKGMSVNKLIKSLKNIDFFNYVKQKLINHPYCEQFIVDFSNFINTKISNKNIRDYYHSIPEFNPELDSAYNYYMLYILKAGLKIPYEVA